MSPAELVPWTTRLWHVSAIALFVVVAATDVGVVLYLDAAPDNTVDHYKPPCSHYRPSSQPSLSNHNNGQVRVSPAFAS